MPAGAEALVAAGHQVMVERGGGEGSGFDGRDVHGRRREDRARRGDRLGEADMIMKVKEPIAGRVAAHAARAGDLHLLPLRRRRAANARAHGLAARPASRTRPWSCRSRELPLLTPMSEVAGRMAVQEGAKYLEKLYGGRGVLLGGVPGVAPAKVVILGGGIVGINAAKMAAGMGAKWSYSTSRSSGSATCPTSCRRTCSSSTRTATTSSSRSRPPTSSSVAC